MLLALAPRKYPAMASRSLGLLPALNICRQGQSAYKSHCAKRSITDKFKLCCLYAGMKRAYAACRVSRAALPAQSSSSGAGVEGDTVI